MSFDFDLYVRETKKQWQSEIIKHERLPLWEKYKIPMWNNDIKQNEPSIIPYIIKNDIPRSAVIVCAGGSYGWKEPLEAFHHAEWLNKIGVHAFVLDYRVTPYTTTHALIDIKRAVRFLRYNSDKFKIDANQIAVMGFSAGGHLSAMLSEQFDLGDSEAADPVERFSCRPDAQILCYPGITFHTFDQYFLKILLGENFTEKDITHTSLHFNVKEDTPPIFFWGTENDFLFEDWLLFFNAVHNKNVPLTVHIFPNGGHSFGREQTHSIWTQWSTLCKEWLKDLNFINDNTP
ncbi:MAG: alpha/beta hydrolase [Oscillospiraceae bacterium]|nr:alpha/beta hydrolase [Oscillospiraceae bacterium]